MSDPYAARSVATAEAAASGSRSSRAPAARPAAIVTVLGAALAIAGFFLPWSATFQPSQTGTQVSTTSGWNLASHWATGSTQTLPNGTHVSTPSSVPFAIVVAMPLIMAVVALALGGIAFFRRPGPLLAGLYAAAGITGVLSVMNDYPAFFLTALNTGVSGPTITDIPLVGLGLALLYMGFFILIAGGFAAVFRTSEQSRT